MDLLTQEVINFLFVSLAINFLLMFLFARNIRDLMRLIRLENQFMSPESAWLLMIPFFNVIYNFKVVRSVSNSLNNEFFDRKIAEEEAPGLAVGMSFAWVTVIAYMAFLPSFIVMTFALLHFVFFIRYWIKVYNFKLLLQDHNRFLQSQKTQKTQKNED